MMEIKDMEFPRINNKLAFFDFDRTLVAHTYSQDYIKARHKGYFMECLYMITSLKEEHAKDKPLPCMQWYARKLYEEGCGLYCLTHEVFNLRDALKQEQLKEFYPDVPMAYLTTDTPEHKIDMMKAIALAEGYDPSDIIFVDDRMETVNLALAEGFDAKHLSDIVALYESRRNKQEQDMEIKPEDIKGQDEEDRPVKDMEPVEDAKEEGIPQEELDRIFRECHKVVDKGGGVPL